jgi:hypothetical protein
MGTVYYTYSLCTLFPGIMIILLLASVAHTVPRKMWKGKGNEIGKIMPFSFFPFGGEWIFYARAYIWFHLIILLAVFISLPFAVIVISYLCFIT